MTQYYDPDGDANWFPPYNPVDIKDPPSWEDTAPSEYEPPHFVNPLDSMPIATENPRPEEEIADDWFTDNPDESDDIEKEKTMHQKMYEIATARYNPFSLGGSENCDSDIDCNIQKHSPWPGGSENFQASE